MLSTPRPVASDILSVGIPKLLNGTSMLAANLLSMRVLDPAAYGRLSFGLACLLMFDGLLGSAFDLGAAALITDGSLSADARLRPAEKAAIWLKALLGLAALAISAAAGEWLGDRFLHTPGGRSFFLTLSAAGTCVLLLRSAQLYFQARLRFRLYGATDAAHAALRLLLVGIVLFATSPSPVSILACFAAAPAGVVAACLAHLRTTAGWTAKPVRRRDFRALWAAAASPLATFSVSAVVSRLDIFVAALRGTAAGLGLYSSALTLATIPEVLGAYVAPVFLPRILPAQRDGTFPALFRKVNARVVLVCAALLAAGLILGRPLATAFLPVRYGASAGLFLILLPGTLASASYFPLTLNFLMLRKSKVFLLVDTFAAPALAAAYYFLIPTHGMVAAAWITCLHRLAKTAAAQSVAARLARDTIRG